MTGLPCKHVIASIAYKNHKLEDYVHNWLCMGPITLLTTLIYALSLVKNFRKGQSGFPQSHQPTKGL